MNWFDILAFFIIIRTAYTGFRQGLSGEIFNIAGITLSWFAAFYFYEKLGEALTFYTLGVLTRPHAESVSFALVFIAGFLLSRAASAVAQKTVRLVFMERLDTIAGVFCGILRGVIMVCIIFMLLTQVSSAPLKNSVEKESFSGKYISNINGYIRSFMQKTDVFRAKKPEA